MLSFYKRLLGKIYSHKNIPPSVVELYFKIRKYLPENAVILEAGAHMGYDTYGLGRIWPKGTVHAFEPVPEVYGSLVDRVKGLGNVKTYNIALGKENGFIDMFVSGGGSTASSSVLRPTSHLDKFPNVTFENKIQVPINKMSDWALAENVTKVDLLWLDMQGYEVYALRGAEGIVERVRVIYTELCTSELYSGLVTRDAYIEFLSDLGFELISTTGNGEVRDGIFVRKNVIDGKL